MSNLTNYADDLSDRGIYNLMGGVRGPDRSGPGTILLKGIITGRLRSIAFKYADGGAYILTTYEFSEDDLEDLQVALGRMLFAEDENPNSYNASYAQGHWLGHLRSAVMATKSHEIWDVHAAAIIELLAAAYDRVGRYSVLALQEANKT